jgi:Uma2 family endonuclease
MSAALRKPMTLDDFLAWEERQELRWEFDGFAPVAMNGGTMAHEVIGGNVRFALQSRLSRGKCRVYGPSLKVEVAGRIRYPDAFVCCSALDRKQTVVSDPVTVFEVLSPGTASTDHLAKLGEYAATPSIQRYVILEQDAIGAVVYARKGTDFVASVAREGDTLEMPELGIAVPMAELYEGVEVQPLEPPEEPAR